MKVLVLGASAMVGSGVFRELSKVKEYEVYGTVRDMSVKSSLNGPRAQLIGGCDLSDGDRVAELLDTLSPHVVINCVGITKHHSSSEDIVEMININALLPHRIVKLCEQIGARVIHISTDCVFSGERGFYSEEDTCDAKDFYGRSKALGEVLNRKSVTLRTSLIGHEIRTRYGLLEWFLSQKTFCEGFTRAIFSGLPVIEFARIIRDIVIPHDNLSGIYHVAAQPISKYDLLSTIASIYGKEIEIRRNENLIINRSLCAEKFQRETGYIPPSWEELIISMHNSR